MSETPTKVIVNCETGVTEVLPLTAAEIADMETARVAAEDQRAAAEAEAAVVAAAKESANAKLAALGLTAEEIAALSK
jgi:putative heme iron utilization protein